MQRGTIVEVHTPEGWIQAPVQGIENNKVYISGPNGQILIRTRDQVFPPRNRQAVGAPSPEDDYILKRNKAVEDQAAKMRRNHLNSVINSVKKVKVSL